MIISPFGCFAAYGRPDDPRAACLLVSNEIPMQLLNPKLPNVLLPPLDIH
jgi:hypothetical protein